MKREDYRNWCFDWLCELYDVLKEGHYAVIFSGDKNLYSIADAINGSEFQFHHFLKWYKPNCQRGLSGTVLFGRTELAFIISKGKPNIKLINRKTLYQDTIICRNTLPNDKDAVDHNARRPVKLYRQIIEGFTKEDDTVLDPFLGSGTTMLACNKRNCIGIEIDPSYCNLIKKRVFGKQFLSHKAIYKYETIE